MDQRTSPPPHPSPHRLARFVVGGAAVLVAVTACSSDGGTAAPAPVASATAAPTATSTTAPGPASPTPTTSTPPATTPPVTTAAPVTTQAPARTDCGVDLGAPEIATAARSLGVEPLTGRAFATTPIGGSFDPCATLSTALVTVEGGTGSSPTQALMFHDGQYLGTGTSKAYGFTEYNPAASSDDTVGLTYTLPASCNACNDGTYTSVRYRWDGTRVQMLDAPPPTS